MLVEPAETPIPLCLVRVDRGVSVQEIPQFSDLAFKLSSTPAFT